jgi:Spy/CpxP family protein refolding chaperone
MAWLVGAAGLIAISGCKEDPPPPPIGPTTSTTAAAAPSSSLSARDNLRKDRGRKGPPGTAALLQRALQSLDLDDAQKAALETVIKARGDDEQFKKARLELNQTLAAGARAGKLDDGVVLPKATAVKAATEAKRKRMVDAINALHQALTPKQRNALATLLGKGDNATWFDEGAESTMALSRSGSRAQMTTMLRGIQLTPEQRETMKKEMSDDEPEPTEDARRKLIETVATQRKAMLESFNSDSFDASTMGLTQEVEEVLGKGIDRQVKAVRVLITLLDGTQRETLAKNLETERPRSRGERRPLHRMGH